MACTGCKSVVNSGNGKPLLVPRCLIMRHTCGKTVTNKGLALCKPGGRSSNYLLSASHKQWLQHAKWKHWSSCEGCAANMCTELITSTPLHQFHTCSRHRLSVQFQSPSAVMQQYAVMGMPLCLPAVKPDANHQPKTPFLHCGYRNTLPGLMAPWEELHETMLPVKLKPASAQAKQRLQKQLYALQLQCSAYLLSPHLHICTA